MNKAEFAARLRELRKQAGSPSFRELARRTHYSASTLAEASAGRRLPTEAVLRAFVAECGGDPDEWVRRLRESVETTRHPESETPQDIPPSRTWRPDIVVPIVIFVAGGVAGWFGANMAASSPVSPTPVAAVSQNATPQGGSFRYDETTGPGCDMVFATGRQEQVAQVEPGNSVDMEHAWQTGRSDEPRWAIPNCTDEILYSQPSTETNRYQWQNYYVWKFFDVPSGVPCTFHIYVADSPMSRYNATYDWTNGKIAGDWVDANAFAVNQATHVGSWYTEGPHTYSSGMAYLMLTDQRGDNNPPSADAPLTASEVRLTCS